MLTIHNRLHRTLIAVLLIVLAAGFPAHAQNQPYIRAHSGVLLDFDTGTVLYEKNADTPIPPASLTKLVTIYITENQVAAGNFTYDTRVNISRNAWAALMPEASLMFLEPGQIVTVRELLRGLAVASGNDAAVAIAEHIAGSEREFAGLMNRTMQNLGFHTMNFVDASGFDGQNIVTAREFAEFCRLYIHAFPDNLKTLHSVREMAYPQPENIPVGSRMRTPPIHQYNRNTLLWRDADVDGLKTGFVNEAGYNFAVTGKRGGMRLVLVTLGGPGRSSAEGSRLRSEDAQMLLSYGFENFSHYRTRQPAVLPVTIWKGKTGTVVPSVRIPEILTVRKGAESRITVRVRQRTEITAPIEAGYELGEITFYDGLDPIASYIMRAPEPVKEGGFFTNIWHSIRLFFRGLSGKKVELITEYVPETGISK